MCSDPDGSVIEWHTDMKSSELETKSSERPANHSRIALFSTVNAKVNRRRGSSRMIWCMLRIVLAMSCQGSEQEDVSERALCEE